MSNFWDMLPVIIIFPTMAIIVKWSLEYKLRFRLIEKGLIDEKTKFLNLITLGQFASSSMKWGLVLTLVGLAILIVQALPYRVEPEVILGIIMVVAGIALLGYYGLAERALKRRNQSPV